MIKKVYEVNPLICPECQGEMRIISFLTDWVVVDRIIKHLQLTFVAQRPPPPLKIQQSIELTDFAFSFPSFHLDNHFSTRKRYLEKMTRIKEASHWE